jgi:hypothetical protein
MVGPLVVLHKVASAVEPCGGGAVAPMDPALTTQGATVASGHRAGPVATATTASYADSPVIAASYDASSSSSSSRRSTKPGRRCKAVRVRRCWAAVRGLWLAASPLRRCLPEGALEGAPPAVQGACGVALLGSVQMQLRL